jgi:hypothetical protein
MLYITESGQKWRESTRTYFEELILDDRNTGRRGQIMASPGAISFLLRNDVLEALERLGSLTREQVEIEVINPEATASIWDDHKVSTIIDWLIRHGFVEEY